jgi:hypothetical protein
MEREWSEALARSDTTFFERVLADDYIATGGLKTQVAVITGLVTFSAQHMRARYTEVWTKENGQWQAHLGHYSHFPDADTTH